MWLLHLQAQQVGGLLWKETRVSFVLAGKKPVKPTKPQALMGKKPAKFALENNKWIIVCPFPPRLSYSLM